MTAYAALQAPLPDGGQAQWEIRSVNNRFLDLSFRLPDAWRSLETELRQRLTQQLARGKVEVRLQITAALGQTLWDEATLTTLAAWQQQLRACFPDAAPLSVADLLRLIGIFAQNDPAGNEGTRAALLALFDQALAQLIAHREREGEQLAHALTERAKQLAQWVEAARALAPEAQQRYAAQLHAAVAAIEAPELSERIRQEVALFAQKVDVAEELDRLTAHLAELDHTLRQPRGPVGKRLDFLMQEFHREANTLAAKAALSELSTLALEMKVVIEQMREQVQNIE